MATVLPFAALRPRPELASRICELPYDVMSTEEARALASGNPLSFLRVSKPEIELPPGTDPYAASVYELGAMNLRKLIDSGSLVQDSRPCFYLYRQIMGRHSQVGVVGVASCQEYLEGKIKKHELTRIDKEEDRVRHIDVLNAQTGPVFLAYREQPEIEHLVSRAMTRAPDIDFVAVDGVRHTSWTIATDAEIAVIRDAFATVPALYIADGHHRSAAAARVYTARKGAGQSAFFLSVIFPQGQLQILPYHRVLKDLAGQSPAELLNRIAAVADIDDTETAEPRRPGEMGMYLQGKWRRLRVRDCFRTGANPIDRLDVSVLQVSILRPVFGIEDPRTSKRIHFVGGIRGTGELEKLVDSGEYACAFSMFPTQMAELLEIADRNGIMPPKSTWFEPKLRDAMFCHLL